MSNAKKRSGGRRAVLAGFCLVVALVLFFTQAGENSWLGRQLGGGQQQNPYAGIAVLRTACDAGAISLLPPRVTDDGVVLPPLFLLELAPGVVVDDCETVIELAPNGDGSAQQSAPLFKGAIHLLPREDGAWGPDGWSVRRSSGEANSDAALHFRVVLHTGGDRLTWQGPVREADSADPRLSD